MWLMHFVYFNLLLGAQLSTNFLNLSTNHFMSNLIVNWNFLNFKSLLHKETVGELTLEPRKL